MEPSIAVLIPTFNRSEVLWHTLSALDYLLLYDGDISFYVGVDGNDDTLYRLGSWSSIHSRRLYASTGPGHGLGSNLNYLLQQAQHAKLFLQLDDDHELTRPLDLNPMANRLMTNKDDGWIRLMGIGSHKYKAMLDGSYWRIDWDSPELYIPSNRPHLKHRRFHEYFGHYPEGLTLGETEEGFCHKCKDKYKATGKGPSVLVPLGLPTETMWAHIGQSWQAKGY